MYVSLYLYKGTIYLPQEAVTEAGFYLQIEPVEVVDAQNTPEFLATLQRAIERGNPHVPTPARSDYAKPALLEYVKVRSWAQLYRESRCWSLSREKNAYAFTPWKLRLDRGLEEDLKNVITFPSETTLRQFLGAVVTHVQAVSDADVRKFERAKSRPKKNQITSTRLLVHIRVPAPLAV